MILPPPQAVDQDVRSKNSALSPHSTGSSFIIIRKKKGRWNALIWYVEHKRCSLLFGPGSATLGAMVVVSTTSRATCAGASMIAVTRGGPCCAALLLARHMLDVRRRLLWRTGCAAWNFSYEPGRFTRYVLKIRRNCLSGRPTHSKTAFSVSSAVLPHHGSQRHVRCMAIP